MDLSKLPKLSGAKSDTTQPAPGDPTINSSTITTEPSGSAAGSSPVPPIPMQPVTYRQPAIGIDIWISLIIGLLMLAMGKNFGSWAIAKARHQPFSTGITWSDDAHPPGQEVEYFDLQGFTALSEMGIFLFGITLLFEAASKTFLLLKPGPASRLLLMLAILLTLGTVLLNIYACLKIFNYGVTPLLSGLAVAFGGWILFDEWTMLKMTRLSR